MSSLWGSRAGVGRLQASTCLAGGVVSLATMTAGYYLYHRYQASDPTPSNHLQAPALQGNRSQGLTLERGTLSSPASYLGLGLGLDVGLGMASFILNADLELVAVQALDPAEVFSGPLLPWEYSPLYCGPVAVWTWTSYCGEALMSSERNHTFKFSWTSTRGSASKKTEIQMRSICMVRGTDTRLWWAMSQQKSRLTPNGFPYVVTTFMAVSGVQLIGGRVRQFQSHVCTKTDVDIPFFAERRQTDVSGMEASLVVGPDGILRTTARTFWISKNTRTRGEESSQDDDSSDDDDDEDDDDYDEDEEWDEDRHRNWAQDQDNVDNEDVANDEDDICNDEDDICNDEDDICNEDVVANDDDVDNEEDDVDNDDVSNDYDDVANDDPNVGNDDVSNDDNDVANDDNGVGSDYDDDVIDDPNVGNDDVSNDDDDVGNDKDDVGSDYDDIASDDNNVDNDDDEDGMANLTAEELEIPCLNYHFTSRGFIDLPYRLTALRQAFTTLLSNPDSRSSLCEAGRLLLGGLATAANKEEGQLYLCYDGLLAYVSEHARRSSIAQELALEEIRHLNVIDVVYELVLLGMMEEGRRRPAVTVSGGFMAQLYGLLEAVLPRDAEEARGQTYRKNLKKMLMDFLEAVFSLPADLYSSQHHLVAELRGQLERHLQVMISSLLNV